MLTCRCLVLPFSFGLVPITNVGISKRCDSALWTLLDLDPGTSTLRRSLFCMYRMCGCIYLCIYVCIYLCIYMYVSVYVYVRIYVYMYMCMCMCMYIYIYMYLCMEMYMCICILHIIYVYVYVCVYVCIVLYMCICVHMYACVCICVHARMDVCMVFVSCVSMYVYIWKIWNFNGVVAEDSGKSVFVSCTIAMRPSKQKGTDLLLAILNSTSASPKPTASEGNFLQGRAKISRVV